MQDNTADNIRGSCEKKKQIICISEIHGAKENCENCEIKLPFLIKKNSIYLTFSTQRSERRKKPKGSP